MIFAYVIFFSYICAMKLTEKELNQLQKEIDYILDTGANSIRLLNMFESFLSKKKIVKEEVIINNNSNNEIDDYEFNLKQNWKNDDSNDDGSVIKHFRDY